MPLSTVNRPKESNIINVDKNRPVIKRQDSREGVDTVRRSDVSVVNHGHRRSDADRFGVHQPVEKPTPPATNEPYLYQCNDFAGVTVFVRTAQATKPSSNIDLQAKLAAQAAGRRRSEFQQASLVMSQRLEQINRMDQNGTSAPPANR